MYKKCFKCNILKSFAEYYSHSKMKDGRLNKCKDCAKKDAKNKTIKKQCYICGIDFKANITELNRGGGITCSRKCFYKRFKEIVKRENLSPNWKGSCVGKCALHDWVRRHLGKPRICEICKTEKSKFYDWANKSQEYKRDLEDWIRLCRSCHSKYDYPFRSIKWSKSVRLLGWKVNKIPF